jgi:2-alkenal reductase
MNLSGDQQGVLIEQVQQGSPADQAGLRGSFKPVTVDGQEMLVGGDVITAVDGQAITAMNDLSAALAQTQPGQTVTLTILRDGQEQQVQVTLGGQ